MSVPRRRTSPDLDDATDEDLEGYEIDNDWQGFRPTTLMQRKPTPLPKLQLAVTLYVQLAEPVAAHVMLPFIVQLVKEIGITGGDVTKVGYYTGVADSLFYLAEALTILQWGRLSDYIGRRPVLFTGLFGLGLSSISFGFSHTFTTVVASRALAGLLNGNKGVIKTVLGELTDETNAAQAFALLPLTWSTGNTISPLIGGMLQHPYERFGGIFLSDFWLKNPYLLPCAIPAFFSTSAFLFGFFFLKETAPCGNRPTYTEHGQEAEYTRLHVDPDTSSPVRESSPFVPTPRPPPLRSLLTPHVLLVIFNYAMMGILEVAFSALQPLVLSTPISNGGLGMSPTVIGPCLASFGFASGTVSALLLAPLTRRFGTRRLATFCVFAYFGCYSLFPIMNALAKIEDRVTPLVWVAFIIQLTLATLPSMGMSCIPIFLTAAAPSSSALGATNGLAQTTAAIMRTLGPAGATSLFALSIRHNLLGGGFVYVVMCFLAVAATVATRLLPDEPWARAEVYDMTLE